jgi:hypothetical protein
MKLELLTNATVVDDAIRFVSQKSEKLRSSTHQEKSKGSAYDKELHQQEKELTNTCQLQNFFNTVFYALILKDLQ